LAAVHTGDALMSVMVRKRLAWGLFFISPWIIGFLVFTLYPMIASLYYSFTSYDVLRPPQWVGLENYVTFFAKDHFAVKAITNTLYYAVIFVPLNIVVAVSVSLLLNNKIKGMAVYRAIFYLPSIVPAVAATMIWVWIFSYNNGLLNYGLNLIGLPKIAWLNDPNWTKPALIIMTLWGFGGAMVIYLAGLQDIPQSLYEAAEVDGAGTPQKLFKITLPLLTPQIFFQLVMGIIGAFQVFATVYILAGSSTTGTSQTLGGPASSLLFYNVYLYFNAFQFFKMGYSSAMAWILFIATMIVTLIVVRGSQRWVFYMGGGR
jgi:multiple sugar transport system permease protein